MTSLPPDSRRSRVGVAYGLAAYLSWGVLPVYFKAVAAVPALEVLAHRVVWSFLFLALLTTMRRRWSGFRPLFAGPRTPLTLAVTTFLIATNWGVFIWAVANGRLVEASLGYFITPLVTVLLSFVFLKERLRRLQTVAVLLATVAIVWMTARHGHPPRVSMILAFSFGFYGLLRKKVPATGVQGLTAETLLLTPVALVWLGWRARQGDLVFGGGDPRLDVLLPAAGLITALPLIWFAEGARRLRLATMGFMHYLAPTGQFLLAVFAFGEPFGADRLVGFLLIWAALGLYTWDTLRGMRPGLDPPGRM